MDPALGSLVIVGISAGTGVGIAKPAGELVKILLSRFLGPATDLAGENLRNYFVERQRRGEQLLVDAVEMLNSANTEPQSVPGRILMPILEKGSLEEDSGFRKRWSALLAQAAINGHSVHPAFPTILAELSSTDARFLDWLYEQTPIPSDPGSSNTVTFQRAMSANNLSERELYLIISNLVRLNLLSISPSALHEFRNLAGC